MRTGEQNIALQVWPDLCVTPYNYQLQEAPATANHEQHADLQMVSARSNTKVWPDKLVDEAHRTSLIPYVQAQYVQ